MKPNRRNGHVMLHLVWLGLLGTAGAYGYYHWDQISMFAQSANEEARTNMTQLYHKIVNSFPK